MGLQLLSVRYDAFGNAKAVQAFEVLLQLEASEPNYRPA